MYSKSDKIAITMLFSIVSLILILLINESGIDKTITKITGKYEQICLFYIR
jgi:hypothetical protein